MSIDPESPDEGEKYPEVVRSLARDYIEDCEYWISRLAPYKRGLTAQESFMLWSSLGYLRFEPLSLDLPENEVRDLQRVARDLQQRLSDAVVRWRSSGAWRSSLEVRLEQGIETMLAEMDAAIQDARRRLLAGTLGTQITSDEFNGDVLYRMDMLGYALELVKDMKSALSKETLDKVAELDRGLREFLPEAEKQFAANRDPIYVVRPVFPRSFWWRFQILHPDLA